MTKTVELLTIDSITLLPKCDLSRKAEDRAVWYLALVYVGMQARAGRRLVPKLKSETAAYLNEVNEHAFHGRVSEAKLKWQMDSAWKICRQGKNNLFRSVAANDNGVLELNVNVGG